MRIYHHVTNLEFEPFVRREIVARLDKGGATTLLPKTRALLAALQRRAQKRPPSLDDVRRDVDRRIERGEIDAQAGIALINEARRAIEKFAEDEEKAKYEGKELKARFRRDADKEMRESEAQLIGCVNREVATFNRQWAKLPSGVHDDSSAMRAGVDAVQAWIACGESYERLYALWGVATQLRGHSFIEATRADGFAPYEYFWRYPNKVRGMTQIVYARNLAEKVCNFADNIAAGAEPGLFTAAELRLFDQQDAEEAARAKALAGPPVTAKKKTRVHSI